jgi:hypothetical protein
LEWYSGFGASNDVGPESTGKREAKTFDLSTVTVDRSEPMVRPTLPKELERTLLESGGWAMRKKQVSRGLGAVTLALLLTAMFVATAVPALAHHPEVDALARCLDDGSYAVAGTAMAWNGTTEAAKTNLGIEVHRDGFSGPLVASGEFTVDNGFSFEWVDSLPAGTAGPVSYVVIATVPWGNGSAPRGENNLDATQTVVVDLPEGCEPPPTTTTRPPRPDPTGTIGDLVWEDTNGDGHQGDFEPGIAGVTVNLIGSSGLIIDTTVTDANGNYLFTGLAGGDYEVQFVVPAGFDVSPLRAATPAADSDAGVAGRTGAIALASGVTDLTWDAGMFRTPEVLPQIITTSTTAASVTVETLPFTGSSGTDAAGLGVALLTLGGLLVLMTRSREDESVTTHEALSRLS